jgi:YVTN family beta-propeller protein
MLVLALLPVLGSAAVEGGDVTRKPGRPADRQVMFVGNNWAGTATVVDVRTHEAIKTLNIVPDREQELLSIYTSPDQLAFYLAVQQGIGEGHDQYVDDLFTTRDGRLLVVSRPSFADVVWIDLATGRIVAEQQMDGYRTDHMAVSPKGRRLLVSDSTANTVHEYVMGGVGRKRTGQRLRTFESGDTPHENSYSRNGRRIFHASIGRVYTPVDYPELGPVPLGGVHDAVKANRWLQIVDNRTFAIERRWDMGKELAESGYPGMSSAVRPMVLARNEKSAFLQVSFLHGIVEFSFKGVDPTGGGDYTSGGQAEPATGVVTRVIPLPVGAQAAATPREDYVLDSAHHGIAMNRRGNRLCVAGTMSDYAAIVSRRTGRHRILAGQARFLPGRSYSKPYWATTSRADGNCWVSMSGSDLVTVISYRTKKVVAEVPVGRHPQRVRDGVVDGRVLNAWAAGGASSQPDLSPLPANPGQLQAAAAWLAAAIDAITP